MLNLFSELLLAANKAADVDNDANVGAATADVVNSVEKYQKKKKKSVYRLTDSVADIIQIRTTNNTSNQCLDDWLSEEQ